jgi:protein TonB
MEEKKTRRADMEQRRTTGFLLGLILVLSICYVTLEWNSNDGTDDIDPVDLTDLMHESELVPMSNEETVMQMEERKQEKGEQLRVVEDDVELQQPEEESEGEGEGDGDDDDEALLKEMAEEEDKALAPLDVDPNNPLNFHIVEDLPKFPGGAVELMKWLTRNLRYPAAARSRKTQGKVMAVFYIEKDGSVTGISISKSLSPECDSEALRVLRKMPKWEPGIQNDQPCRTKVSIPIVFKL